MVVAPIVRSSSSAGEANPGQPAWKRREGRGPAVEMLAPPGGGAIAPRIAPRALEAHSTGPMSATRAAASTHETTLESTRRHPLQRARFG